MTDETTRAAFLNVEAHLNTSFLERATVIRGMVVALLASEHVLLLGPPGTGKSALARAFAKAALSTGFFFQWLLTRFTTPEELFGPVSLESLKAGTYERVTAGKLPTARLAFLDEIFKAGSSILNTLLTALNEGLFYNNGTPVEMPLEMCVGASNELPESEELAALYDRFSLRYWVRPIEDPDTFDRLLCGGDPTDLASHPGFSPLSDEQVEEARRQVALVAVPQATRAALWELKQQLQAEGVTASDRRWKQCLGLLRADAWLGGDAEVEPEHFGILQHALWEEPEQQAVVAKVVAQSTSRELAEAVEVHDAVLRLIRELPADGDANREQQVIACMREGGRAEGMLEALAEQCSSRRSRQKIEELVAHLKQAMTPVRAAGRAHLGL